ncbi:PRC-barrel domain-containing protein [Virgibacillus salidurans]|uniref:PRC-barrel domain-containing protein n=1 Tax=Virgibacillus salidurans TaxID=2831673 RepID=UPI001F2949BB|nr:PRC-barrel domain-containing protein [Virgibacillus sp. NKC19-16]
MFFTSDLKTYNIDASDGEMGKIKDVYFDDKKWAIRYAVVDTRKWLPGRKVLLSPRSFINLNEANENLEVEFDKETIRNSPSIADEQAVSKEAEKSIIGYYGWSRYWIGNPLWGIEYGSLEEPTEAKIQRDQQMDESQEYDLRSEDETIGFKVHANDGKIGRVADMIYDNESWKIQYVVVRSSKSMVEEEYFVYTPEDIESVDWFGEDIYVKDSLENVNQSTIYKNKADILLER